MICVTKTNEIGLPVDLIKLGEFDGCSMHACVCCVVENGRSKLWRRQTKTVDTGERRREHIVDTVLASAPAPTSRGPRGVKLYSTKHTLLLCPLLLRVSYIVSNL